MAFGLLWGCPPSKHGQRPLLMTLRYVSVLWQSAQEVCTLPGTHLSTVHNPSPLVYAR